jgi:hypothetical protein
MKKFLLVTVIILLSSTATADERVYKWIDKDGSVHFSDKPTGHDATPVLVSPTPPNRNNLPPPQEKDSSGKSKPAVGEIMNAEDNPEVRAKNCEKAKKLVQAFEKGQGRRLYEDKKDGTRHYLSDEERVQRTKDAHDAVTKWCS